MNDELTITMQLANVIHQLEYSTLAAEAGQYHTAIYYASDAVNSLISIKQAMNQDRDDEIVSREWALYYIALEVQIKNKRAIMKMEKEFSDERAKTKKRASDRD